MKAARKGGTVAVEAELRGGTMTAVVVVVVVADLGNGGDGGNSPSVTRPGCILSHLVGPSSFRHTE